MLRAQSFLKTFLLLLKYLWRTGALVHLVVWSLLIHLSGQLLLIVFRSELFGALSLSSVIPVPTSGKFNFWLLVCSGLFCAGTLGAILLPYFHSEGRERFVQQERGSWLAFSLASLAVCLILFTGLVEVFSRFSMLLGGFALKVGVPLFGLKLLLILSFISMAYTVGSLALFVSPGVALFIVGVVTIGIQAMTMLDRFGLWSSNGLVSVLPKLFPSGDLGFDLWKWLNGASWTNGPLWGWVGSATLAVVIYVLLLRFLPSLRRMTL